jgi:hypothetical protein
VSPLQPTCSCNTGQGRPCTLKTNPRSSSVIKRLKWPLTTFNCTLTTLDDLYDCDGDDRKDLEDDERAMELVRKERHRYKWMLLGGTRTSGHQLAHFSTDTWVIYKRKEECCRGRTRRSLSTSVRFVTKLFSFGEQFAVKEPLYDSVLGVKEREREREREQTLSRAKEAARGTLKPKPNIERNRRNVRETLHFVRSFGLEIARF